QGAPVFTHRRSRHIDNIGSFHGAKCKGEGADRLPLLMLSIAKKNIRHLDLGELEAYFDTLNEKKFRAKQAYEWIWQKQARSFDSMTNLSKELRAKLSEHFSLPALRVDAVQHSGDGTIKSRFKTADGHLVEGVLIPTESRQTACVSS